MRTSRQNTELPTDFEPIVRSQGLDQPATGGREYSAPSAVENSPTDADTGPLPPSGGVTVQADAASALSSVSSTNPAPLRPVKTGHRVVRINENDLSLHLPRLRSVIQWFVAEDDVEDILQDVMLTALNKLSGFRGEAAVGTWLHRIAVNAALAHRRRRAKVAKREESLSNDDNFLYQPLRHPRRPRTVTPDEDSERKELSVLLQDAIAKLPPKYREVYTLADVEGWYNEAIARELKLTVSAVKSRLFRARKMMRDQLAPYWEDEPTRPNEPNKKES